MAPTDMGHPKLGHKQSRAHMYTLTCVLHTCTHKHIDTKSSIPLQWQRKAEGTCMFNLQPSISACSCSYATHCDPQPPPSIPYTPSRKSKEEVNKACREWVSTYGGEVKPTTFLISQSGSSVMEVQHSKLILFLSWVYTWPFSASNFMFTERVSLLTAYHPNSYRLFLSVPHWRIIWDDEEAETGKEWKIWRETGRERLLYIGRRMWH